MNTKEMESNYRLAHWAVVIRDRRESGLSIKAFCKAAGIHENMYYYWQRKLRLAALEHLTESPAPVKQENRPTPRFAEVRLESASVHSSLPEPAGRLCVELAGLRLTADGDYPPEHLARLLRELLPC